MPKFPRSLIMARHVPLVWPAMGYMLFVAYGSLVPLKFHAMPMAEAWLRFCNLLEVQEVRTSTVDWAVNIVLYMPLTFLWLGTLWHRWRLDLRLAASLLVLFAGVGFSCSIEFAQLFFAERTSSINDIVANTLGSALGVSGWWWFGLRARQWLAGWHVELGRSHMLEQVLYAYLALLLFYSLMPLDLSISPVEIYHKWKAGMVRLVPFAALPDDVAQASYGLLTDIALWLIPAWLALRAGRYRPRQILLGLVLMACAIEVLQLFVMSRVSDSTSVLLAGLGSMLGLQWAPLAPGHYFSGRSGRRRWLLALTVWIVLIFALLWYPFQFQVNWQGVWLGVSQKLAHAPLSGYYQNSELGALTSMMRKMGLFLPLGLLLGLPRDGRRQPALAAAAVIVAMSLLVELGQTLQPGGFGDIADGVLQMIGGMVGWWLAGLFDHTASAAIPSVAPSTSQGTPAQQAALPLRKRKGLSPWLLLALGLGLMSSAFVFALQLPGIPYNFRELIAPESRLQSAVFLSVSVYWMAGAPLLATSLLLPRSRWLWSLLLWPLVHGVMAFLLLVLAVPLESINDVLGSPVLGWPWKWEHLGRFIGLFAVPSVWLIGGMLLAGRQRLRLDRRATAVWSIGAVFWLQFAYWVVVVQADTDNLVELMADDASWFAASALGGALATLLIAATYTARRLAGRRSRWWRGGLMLLLMLPLTFGLVWLGSEGRVMKYEQTFSALQFLLSRDRTSYADFGTVLLRFCLAYLAAATLIVWVQYPFWKRNVERVDNQSKAPSKRPAIAPSA